MGLFFQFFLLFIAIANINCEQYYDVGFKSIQPVLDYIKNNPEKYNIDYVSAKILKTQIKDEIIELDLEVTGDCIKNPCNSIVHCKSQLNAASYEVINVDCKELNKDGINTEERLTPSQNKLCTGCLEEVNLDAEGINPLVDVIIEHVESEKQIKYGLVDVLRAQRQVINGVKYFLTVKIAPTICDSFQKCYIDTNQTPLTCTVTFIQEPGYMKPKNIISNTCTESQTFVSRTDSNSIYQFDATTKFNRKRTDNEVLNDIVSQIIPNKLELSSIKNNEEKVPHLKDVVPTEISRKNSISSIESVSMKNIESSSIHNMESGPLGIVSSSSFQEVFATEDKPISPGTDSVEQVVTSNSPKGVSAILNDDLVSTDGLSPLSVNEKQIEQEIYENLQLKDNFVLLKSQSMDKELDREEPTVETNPSKILTPLKRPRRMIVNSYKISSKERRIIHDMANNIAETLDNIDDDNHKRVVLSIINVKKVKTRDELFYHLVLRIGVSHCKEDSTDDDCEQELIDDLTKLCKIQVLVKDNKYNKPKIVKSHCQNIKKPDRRNNRTSSERRKRDTMVGGKTEISVSDPIILELLDETMSYLNTKLYRGSPLEVVKVIKATSQVVAGISYDIEVEISKKPCGSAKNNDLKCKTDGEICNINVWDRPWIPSRLVTVQCPSNTDPIKFDLSKKISKRSIPGGEEEVEKDNPQISEYLQKSLQHMDLNSPQENKFKVKEVLSVTKQVVAGQLWQIKIKLIESDCEKNDVTESEQCGELQGAEPKICTVKVWDRPWLKQGRETNITCENQKTEYTFRSKRHANFDKTPYPSGKSDLDAQLLMFKNFMNDFNKTYSNSKEYKYRFSVFRENMKFVKLLNEYEQGTAKYGVTQFADISQKEFSRMLGYRADLRNTNDVDFMQADIPNIKLPESFDWREKGAVTEVKNQGQCGSCWAFSVTGNVEGQYAIKNGNLLEFSEQELVDCDTVDSGCNGGLMDNAYRQIEKLGGLEEEKDYPYDARDEKCHFKKNLARVQLAGAVNISSDETSMAKWLTQNGPISIAINANAMQFYVGGVSHPFKFLCNPKSLDHGVLIVGYGNKSYPKFKKELPYWTIKNSWGKRWGEQGYYRVYRGDGTCGVNQTPSSAILK